jgi:hypothetical protein
MSRYAAIALSTLTMCAQSSSKLDTEQISRMIDEDVDLNGAPITQNT